MQDAFDFENDIFISYAHIDNETLTSGEEGWIANFHRSLEVRIRQLLGGEAKIWRDAKLQGNDEFSDTLISQFPKVALLVSILSPRYLKSDWCLREVQTFLHVADQNTGIQLGGKSRLFKVVKTHVPLESQPPALQGMLGYEFYEIDQATSRPREFRQEAGTQKDNRYWDKLEDLAYDIAHLLQHIKDRDNHADAAASTPPKGSIYLAHTVSDIRDVYDQIKRELQQRGYQVLPDRPLPQNASELERAVRDDLQRCSMAIHLIGRRYGLIPEAATCSIVEIQNALAAERCQDPTFSRIIWLPSNLQPEEERQRAFVQQLQTNPAAHKNADVLQTDISVLKTSIFNLLSGGNASCMAAEDDTPRTVYLLHADEDFDAVDPIISYLLDAGFEVLSPLIEGEGEDAREEHHENLAACDAAILYYGQADDRWFSARWRDLREGVGRSTPMVTQALYLGAPDTRQKQRVAKQTRRATVITNFDTFTPDDLQSFMALLKKS